MLIVAWVNRSDFGEAALVLERCFLTCPQMRRHTLVPYDIIPLVMQVMPSDADGRSLVVGNNCFTPNRSEP